VEVPVIEDVVEEEPIVDTKRTQRKRKGEEAVVETLKPAKKGKKTVQESEVDMEEVEVKAKPSRAKRGKSSAVVEDEPTVESEDEVIPARRNKRAAVTQVAAEPAKRVKATKKVVAVEAPTAVKKGGRRGKKAEVEAEVDEDEVPMKVAPLRKTRSKEIITVIPPVKAAPLRRTRSDDVAEVVEAKKLPVKKTTSAAKKAAAKKEAIVEEEELVVVKAKKAPAKKIAVKKAAAKKVEVIEEEEEIVDVKTKKAPVKKSAAAKSLISFL
jgi:hypothetical protein